MHRPNSGCASASEAKPLGVNGALRLGRFTPRYSAPYDAEFRWAVEAYEDVTVPAGTFKAFRIVYRIAPRLATNFARQSWQSVAPSTVTLKYWYAPEVRQFVKADGDSWVVRFDLVATTLLGPLCHSQYTR